MLSRLSTTDIFKRYFCIGDFFYYENAIYGQSLGFVFEIRSEIAGKASPWGEQGGQRSAEDRWSAALSLHSDVGTSANEQWWSEVRPLFRSQPNRMYIVQGTFHSPYLEIHSTDKSSEHITYKRSPNFAGEHILQDLAGYKPGQEDSICQAS